MRQIILDTETTGLYPEQGHRIIEIGCVELINRKLTGNHFHQYINPEREVEAEAISRSWHHAMNFCRTSPFLLTSQKYSWTSSAALN